MKKILCLILLVLNVSVFAKEMKIPPVEPAFVILNQDESPFTKEELTGLEIIEFSMMFGQTEQDSAEYNQSIEKYKAVRTELLKYKTLSEKAFGEKILEVMYQKVLKNYVATQTKVDVLFKNGTYNCVSSSLLYLALAKDFGLDARVQETEEHAFITLYLKNGKKIDVETTNPFGFDPGTEKTLDDSGMYFVVPKSYYRDRHEVSTRKAVVLVAQNICSQLNDISQYENAIPLFAAACEFVQKEKNPLLENFEKLMVNFAIDGVENRQTSEVLDFLEHAMEVYPDLPGLQNDYSDFVYNQAVEFNNNGNLEQLKKLFEERGQFLNKETYEEIQQVIFENNLYQNADEMSPDEGIAYIQQLRKNNKNKDANYVKNLEEMEEYYWSQKIAELIDKEEFLAAANLCDEGAKSLPKSRYFRQVKSQCLENHGYQVHNQVGPLVEAGKYSQAYKIIEEALKDNPKDRTLLNDLKILKRYIK